MFIFSQYKSEITEHTHGRLILAPWEGLICRTDSAQLTHTQAGPSHAHKTHRYIPIMLSTYTFSQMLFKDNIVI